MISLVKENRLFDQRMGDLLLNKEPEKTLVFHRNGLIFAFNFAPDMSLENVLIPVSQGGDYEVALSTDDSLYGGWDRIKHMNYPTKIFDGQEYLELYIPARTAVVLKLVPKKKKSATKTRTKRTKK